LAKRDFLRFTMPPDSLYLASASPRRHELLEQIGVRHTVRPVDVDESRQPGEPAADYVLRLAREKAAAGWARFGAAERCPVLAADTAVVLDEAILGKPRDRQDALAMLEQLSGRTHGVLTAVAIASATGTALRLNSSRVTFRLLEPGEAGRYWDTGEASDKAGAYAVQGRAATFIERLEGSFSGVMGLPLFETAQLLAEAGIPLWNREQIDVPARSPAGD
jgi:septum formation protein